MATSPLFWRPDRLKVWVAKGNDPNSMPDGHHPLVELAAERGDLAAVAALVKAGANIDKPSIEQHTALEDAVENRNESLATFLIHHGANPLRAGVHGTSPLYTASGYNELKVLVATSAGHENLNPKGGIAWTPLGRAVLSGSLESARFLMDHGGKPADPSFTLMHYAAMIGCYPIQWDLLVDNRPAARYVTGNRSFFSDNRAENQSPKMIRFLLKRGLKVDAKGPSGRTPLAVAALGDNVEAAKALVALGANKKAKDAKGLTPSDIALQAFSYRVYKFLTGKNPPTSRRPRIDRAAFSEAGTS